MWPPGHGMLIWFQYICYKTRWDLHAVISDTTFLFPPVLFPTAAICLIVNTVVLLMKQPLRLFFLRLTPYSVLLSFCRCRRVYVQIITTNKHRFPSHAYLITPSEKILAYLASFRWNAPCFAAQHHCQYHTEALKQQNCTARCTFSFLSCSALRWILHDTTSPTRS